MVLNPLLERDAVAESGTVQIKNLRLKNRSNQETAFKEKGTIVRLRRLGPTRDFLLPFRLEPDHLGFAPMAATTTTMQRRRR
jgi:hypothetical protein